MKQKITLFMVAVTLLANFIGCNLDSQLEQNDGQMLEQQTDIDNKVAEGEGSWPAENPVTRSSASYRVGYEVEYIEKKEDVDQFWPEAMHLKRSTAYDGRTAGAYSPNHGVPTFRVWLGESYSFGVEYEALRANSWTWEKVSNGAWVGDNPYADKEIKKIKIRLQNAPAGYHIRYRIRGINNNWSDWEQDGATAQVPGLVGQHMKQLEVVLIKPALPQLSINLITTQISWAISNRDSSMRVCFEVNHPYPNIVVYSPETFSVIGYYDTVDPYHYRVEPVYTGKSRTDIYGKTWYEFYITIGMNYREYMSQNWHNISIYLYDDNDTPIGNNVYVPIWVC